jgi:hypothetical protein
MRTFILKTTGILIISLLSACNFPGVRVPLLSPSSETTVEAETQQTVEPTQNYESTACGFMWASNPLPELSDDFNKALRKVQPQASGYAEAYGENCIDNEGKIVRFLTKETDFHVTLNVNNLEDKQTLGELIEQVVAVVAKYPPEDTPGPQPGYVGITFEAPTDELHLWFTQMDAETALKSGLKGETLFNALQPN